jgi:hypothetical protein
MPRHIGIDHQGAGMRTAFRPDLREALVVGRLIAEA